MKKIFLITGFLMVALVIGFSPATTQAQFLCGPQVTTPTQCTTTADCFSEPDNPCPGCFTCQNGECLPDHAMCDDGTGCTTGVCEANFQTGELGCNYSSNALGPNGLLDLDIECYMCEPTENGVTVDNGICDPGAGETCDNSVDCQVDPGQPCGTPLDPNPFLCETVNIDIWNVICNDNDRCTTNECMFVAGAPSVCINNPITACDATADGCCPEGCEGAPIGNPNGCLDENQEPIPGCDADCWAPQSCGDGQVQPPETCDDAANVGDAGLAPDGTAITDEQCRDPRTAGECTACGDGIVQAAAGEECDGTQNAACGEGGICNAPGTLGECTCAATPPAGICVTGSGNPFDTIRTNCGNCSLNLAATSQGPLKDHLGWILLGFGVAIAMFLRFRRA